MRKQVITVAVAAALGLGSTVGGYSLKAEAASMSKLNQEQKKIDNQQTDVQSNINEAKDKVNDLQNQQTNVKSEMERIDLALEDTTQKIEEKSEKVEETKAEITKLQEEIKVIQERIEKRDKLMKERFRSYQENGGMVNYLDVLLGAQSFSDFIDRVNAVSSFMEADKNIIQKHEADKKEMEEKEAKVEKDLAGLKTMVADLQKMNQQLNSQRAQKDQLLTSLNEQEQKAQEDVMDLQEQQKILAAQEAAIQKAIQLEKERQASAAQSGNGKGSSGGSTSGMPPVSSGSFTRPAEGSITSTYGPRWGTFHWGVDIAKAGTVPIVAAADGVVYTSHYSSSYGNVVYILHNINGQMYTTVYAHMRTRLVSEGAVVKKGQQIGIMGNTGDSQGQHLHFELYRGKWAYHSAINPMGIVPL